jgi:hypothetical protein
MILRNVWQIVPDYTEPHFQKIMLFCRTSVTNGSREDGIRQFKNVTRRKANEK